jgi:prolyl-tRNA editing enzyme YbaK/EbsC (Cys-tRNA(Pro) deacylase)
VLADATVAGAGVVAIGGGAHGVNVHVDADALITALSADVADVTVPGAAS